MRFSRERLRLSPGGIFDFDAVSEDESIICCISTSVGETTGGNRATSKLSKMKADVLHLILIPGEKKKVMVFTDSDMASLLKGEQANGRIPSDIEILISNLPTDIHGGLYSKK
jgi:hypothetical protein